jgi:hypothetical protein
MRANGNNECDCAENMASRKVDSRLTSLAGFSDNAGAGAALWCA